MSATSTTRRDVLATSAAAGAFSLIADQMPQAAEGNIAIRAFHNINVPETALVDLRRRIAATQWPERKTSEPRSDHFASLCEPHSTLKGLEMEHSTSHRCPSWVDAVEKGICSGVLSNIDSSSRATAQF